MMAILTCRKTHVNKIISKQYLLFAAILAGIIFAIDLILPLGVAIGVPYIVVILVTLQTPYRHAVIIAAAISTVLVLLGLVFSPEGGQIWKVYTNRAIAIAAIWIVALLVDQIKKEKEKLLQRSKVELKEAQRTAKLGILRIDFLENSAWWSDDLYTCLGLVKDECTPTYDLFFKHIHVDDVDRVREAIETLRQSETAEAVDIEFRTVIRDGNVLHIHAVFNSEKDSTGQSLRCMGICHNISDRKMAEEALREKSKSIALMENIAATANESNNTDETIKTCLDMICSYTEWPIGHYFASANDGSRDLVSTNIWHLKYPERFKTFLKVTKESRFSPGIGLPGQVLSSGKAKWIVDVSKDTNFPRAKLAEDIGVKAGFAFPIKIGKDIFGVLEFFSEEFEEPNLDELEIMDYVGTQLGRVIERKQAEKAIKESETKFRHIIEGSLQGIIVHRDCTPLFANQKWADIFGYNNPEEILELNSILDAFWVQEEHDRIMDYKMLRMSGNEAPDIYECRGKRKDDSLFWFESYVTTIDWQGEKAIQIAIIDITDRKQVEEELQKLSRAVEYSSSSVYITDLKGKIEYINPKFTEVTGFSKEEAIGKSTSILQSGETSDVVYADMWKTISLGGEWKGEFHNRKKNGCIYRARNSISGVRNNEGHITHYVAIQEDVSFEYELTEQLNYQASHDTLTGLVNRREFERRADRLLATVQENKDNHALCFMDLDQFKVVNDTCGHAAGDELLRQLSSVLEEIVRHRDTLARLGGDEFGILMEHCSIDAAHRVTTSIHKAIQGYQFSWEGRSFKIGVSMGLVPITESTLNLTELLKQADGACYMAKEKGRNRIHVYHAEDSEMAQRHGEMQWVARLNQALDEDRFCLYAQIIEPLDGSNEKHYELLLRMIDKKGKIIPPGAFLPAAERYNLVSKLDYWVIENTFDLLLNNPLFLEQVNFCSINLSGQSLTAPEILDYIITRLNESGIEGKKICFEITETAAIYNMGMATKFISTLKEFGCRFALDDFGSGLSSFGYLKNLPVDFLKIDGVFVKDIVNNPIDCAMVKSINEIGQVMGMKTIAEFVENNTNKLMLKDMGVDYAQGYGIGKPQSFDKLLARESNITDIRLVSIL
jgi:diguanylate cyclase (GGDEF)-like protein/PAS domain S-box-containing protein